MTFFRTCETQKLRMELLKVLERHAFLSSLIRFRYYFDIDENVFIDIANQLTGKETTPEAAIKHIAAKVDDAMTGKDLIKVILDNFKRNQSYYGWDGIRYFLYEYEVSLKEASKTYSDKLSWDVFSQDDRDYHTVEHIYPQRPRKKEWTSIYSSYTTKQKSTLRHSLGNLVPLSKPKNSSFSNKSFEDKKSNKTNTIGFIYGCFSENEVAKNTEWTAKEILERGIKLLKFMEERWNIKIDNKVEFLGLGFVEKKLKIKK